MSFRETRLATVLATFVLLVLLLMPGEEPPRLSLPGLDKLAHVLLFAAWALALRFDWEAFRRCPALLLAATALAAPLTEAMQLLAPGRAFDPLDMGADLAGAALAAAFGAAAVRLADRLLGPPPPSPR
ncbi:MAG TPA: VanZ family protein [Spirochaetales bacterium]|nr:VanZ family protein [Spirochaetales bacterium]HRY55410.1 VanZ family protein [Spirochaetia bacterium]HRZ64236.1 VanZ family protein [Spirochaetia bacterium]